ncbi:ferric-chelate reductase, partial [Elysia marginata]
MRQPPTSSWCLACVILGCVTWLPATTHAQIQTLAGSGNFVADADCGSTKVCYSDCQGATGCTYEAACAKVGTNAECAITVKADGITGDAWLALGFSSDDKMGDDSVTGCKRIGGSYSVFNAFNNGKSPRELATDGSTLTSGTSKDSVVRCVFSREMAAGLSGERYDLSQSYHWMVARGSLGGSQNPTQPPATTQAPTAGGSVRADIDCGTTKFCFRDCTASGCKFQVACRVLSPQAQAQCTLSMQVGQGNVWVGWALSADQAMGNDTVIGCKSVNGAISAFNSENSSPPRLGSTEYSLESGITLDSSAFNNGVLQCTLTRPLTSAQGSRQYDLSQPWYWFIGTGALDAAANTIQYHRQDKYISPRLFDLTASP